MEFVRNSQPSSRNNTLLMPTSKGGKANSSENTHEFIHKAKNPGSFDQKVTIKKFDPRVIGKKSDSVKKHLRIEPNSLPTPRLPPQPIHNKELEEKPWYMLTFDEVVTIQMTKSDHEEKVKNCINYNKSFVTKIKEPEKIKFAFNSPVSHTPQNSKNGHSKSLNSPKTSQCTSPSKKSNQMDSKYVKKLTNLEKEQKVQESIKSRRLKVSELEEEINKTNILIKEHEKSIKKENVEVQQAIQRAEISDSDLLEIKKRSAKIISSIKDSIHSLIHNRKSSENLHNALVKEIKSWETKYFEKMNRNNILSIEEKVEKELRRQEIKRIVCRGLIKFAQMVRNNSFPSFQPPVLPRKSVKFSK